MILSGEIAGNGIVPLPDWITKDRLVAKLAERNITVAFRLEDGTWHVLEQNTASAVVYSRSADMPTRPV
jgi:hypothetical protein